MKHSNTLVLSPEELVAALVALPNKDTVWCVLIVHTRIGLVQRTYSLAVDETEVWGCDPDGNEITYTHKEFIDEKNSHSLTEWVIE